MWKKTGGDSEALYLGQFKVATVSLNPFTPKECVVGANYVAKFLLPGFQPGICAKNGSDKEELKASMKELLDVWLDLAKVAKK